MSLLALSGVCTFYGAIQALHGVDITVEPGEIVTLIGANGAGKSTLMMTICGDPAARAGSIHFDGQDITAWPTHRIMRAGIAQAPEGRRIFPRMSVHENLLMGAQGGADPDMLAQVFALFPRLRERTAQRGGTLSGGEQQMLAIGRALLANPELIMLDEPSIGLSPALTRQMFEVVRALHAQGVTILLVEQNVAESLALCDRAYLLENGVTTLEGTGAALLEDDRIRRSYLGL